MYPDNIRESFGWDNETIMSYKTQVNNVQVMRLDEKWHFKHDHHEIKSYEQGSLQFRQQKNALKVDIKNKNVQLIHFISKNFGLVFE